MTDIQVKYWTMKEGARHNLAMEQENYRHNVQTEIQAGRELLEAARHNSVQEKLTHRQQTIHLNVERAKLNELSRHNRATEYVSHLQAQASAQQAAASMLQAATRRQELAFAQHKWTTESQRILAEIDERKANTALSHEKKFTEQARSKIESANAEWSDLSVALGNLNTATKIVAPILKEIFG